MRVCVCERERVRCIRQCTEQRRKRGQRVLLSRSVHLSCVSAEGSLPLSLSVRARVCVCGGYSNAGRAAAHRENRIHHSFGSFQRKRNSYRRKQSTRCNHSNQSLRRVTTTRVKHAVSYQLDTLSSAFGVSRSVSDRPWGKKRPWTGRR